MSGKYDKPIIDRQKCIGCGSCMVVAPEAFELDAQNISIVKQTWTEVSDEHLLQAVQDCPVQAISIKEKQSQS
ncbi:MAG: ferredoxin [Candidatus Cloacimonetes bacterium]|nr:ferredoxin [Candidatus Cloacimonadota bacterium]